MAVLPLLLLYGGVLLFLADSQGVRGQQAFRTEPLNVTVRAGATVVLKCEVLRVSGSVQWAKDGLLLGPLRALPGHPRYTMTGDESRGQYHLQIVDVRLEDDSPYECQVSRSKSSQPIISRTVWINVQIPPSKPYIALDSEEPWVEGEEYSVTCSATNSKPDADITLFRDGEELSDVRSFTEEGSEDKLLDTHAVVRFRARRADNGRPLLCRVQNPAITLPLETQRLMNVYSAAQTANLAERMAKEAALVSTAGPSNPPPLFLSAPDLQCGQHFVRADPTPSSYLRVAVPPQVPVIEGLSSAEVKAGVSLTLVCLSYGGNPLATVHWTKNGEVLSTTWEVDTASQRAVSTLNMDVKPEDNEAVLRCESVNLVSRSPLSVTRALSVLFEPAEVVLRGSSEALEGKEVFLCCYTTSSNPPVHIRWWLGSQELSTNVTATSKGENGGMTTMSNLTHTVSREENGLLLTCEAFNKGTRFSSVKSRTLGVYYPPQKVWLDVSPPGTPHRSGTTIRLVCFSSGGNPTGRLTWFKNGKIVQGSSRLVQSERGVSREYLLTLTPSDNMATYRCDATNEAKKVLSTEIKLHVQFPAVSVKIVPSSTELRAGHTLDLLCVAGSSNPRANISWSQGATRLVGIEQPPKKAEYGGVTVSSKLALPLGSHHHGNRITCQAFSNLLSEGVNTFYTLNVLFSPEFSANQPAEVEVIEDDTATLPVMVSANPDEMSCEWIFHGEKIEHGHHYHFPGGWALEIRNVTRRDTGYYTVECSNTEGRNGTRVRLNVQYAPSVRMKADPVTVNVGDTADLLCMADANPVTSGMFSWKWMGNGKEEDLGEESQDEATGLLTLYKVTRAQAGPYRCTADNGIAPPASVVGQLVVRFAPELQKGAQWRKVASRGDGSTSASIVCQAEGVPRVNFTWAKNSVPLDFTNPRYLKQTESKGVIHISTLTVMNVSAALDYAIFTCTARNSQGEDTLDIQLLSTNYPDPPSELKILSVTASSVTLEWMPEFDGGLAQNFRVRYRWAGSASYLYVDVFPPRSTVYTVRGLNPSTTYNFSVNAINSMGESGYADNGAVLIVTTMASVGPEPVPDGPQLDRPLDPARVYVAPVLVGGVLLNALGCFLFIRWRKGRSLSGSTGVSMNGKKSEHNGSTASDSSSSRYKSQEWSNTWAGHTPLLNPSSETASSSGGGIYESYGGQESCHYYYPSEIHRPALYCHPEDPGRPGANHVMNLAGHEYEEVRDYQEVLTNALGPAARPGPADWPGPASPASYPEQARWYGGFGSDPARAVYSYGQSRDSSLPFELRGELV